MSNWKRTFAIVWIGQFFSVLTSSVVGYALIFWLSIKTGSTEVLALLFAASILPQILLGPFIGVYVDRWDRKRIMILSDSFIALCTLGLFVLFAAGIESIEMIYVLQICRSLGSSFHVPSMQASVPLLAPESELTRIAGVNQMIQSVSTIAGPALGALMISITSIQNVLLLDVFGALIACVSLLFVSIPRLERDVSEYHFFNELKESVAAVRAVRGLDWLVCLAIISTFVNLSIAILFPIITLQYFRGDSFSMSVVESVWGIGLLLGGFVLALYKLPIRKIVLLGLNYVVLGVALFLSGILTAEQFVWFCVLTFVGGIAGSIFSSLFVSILQTKIESAVLGRVLSIYGSLCLIPALFGLLGMGTFVERFGLQSAFVVAGLVNIGLGFALFLIVPLRTLRD